MKTFKKTQLKHVNREKGPEQKQQRAMTQVAQWKLNIKEWRSPTLTVESTMGAHTLEVMAINSAPLSTTKLKGPEKFLPHLFTNNGCDIEVVEVNLLQ